MKKDKNYAKSPQFMASAISCGTPCILFTSILLKCIFSLHPLCKKYSLHTTHLLSKKYIPLTSTEHVPNPDTAVS